MQRHYLPFFVLVFLSFKEEKLTEGEEFLRGIHGYDRGTVTVGPIHSSIITGKFTSHTCSALAQKGACGSAVNSGTKTLFV